MGFSDRLSTHTSASELMHDQVGTIYYVAPEVLSGVSYLLLVVPVIMYDCVTNHCMNFLVLLSYIEL